MLFKMLAVLKPAGKWDIWDLCSKEGPDTTKADHRIHEDFVSNSVRPVGTASTIFIL